MGGIISKPVEFIYTKVDNTKKRIKKKITDTRDSIYNRIDNTRNSIKCKILGVKNGIVTKVTNTRDAIYQTYDNTKNGISNRINTTKNYICTTRDSIKSSVVSKVNNVKEKYHNAKISVTNKYNSGKDKVTSVKNSIYSKYRQAREAKLTKKQKAKYAILLIIFMFVTSISSSLLLDVYHGDYENANYKLNKMHECSCIIASHAWDGTKIAGNYFQQGTEICLKYILIAAQWLGENMYHASKLFAQHAWYGFSVFCDYFYQGLQVTWEYFVYFLSSLIQLIWITIKAIAFYIAEGSKFVINCTIEGTKVGAEYTVIGSKKAGEYALIGSKYAYNHGTVALKEGSIKFLHGSWYVLTNFRQASGEGAVLFWEGIKSLSSMLLTGSYYGSELLWDGTKYLANVTYHGSISGAELSGQVAKATFFFATDATVSTFYYSKYTTEKFVHNVVKGTINTANFTKNCVVACYTGAVNTVYYTYYGITVSAEFIYSWTYTIAMTLGHWCHIILNQVGLRWLYAISNFLLEWAQFFGHILWKFLRDLALYLGNFFYLLGSHIYNVIYIIVAFLYSIVSAISTLIKVCINGLVYCVTHIFKVVIFFLEETIFAYMFMLHKYNMYREILFLIFIAVISIYCTGLMKDRGESGSDESGDDEDETSDDEEDGCVGDGDDDYQPRVKKKEPVIKMKDLALPPIYITQPSVDTPTESNAFVDFIDDSDIDSDFRPDDQEVPDYLDSSDGEEHIFPIENKVKRENPTELEGASEVELDSPLNSDLEIEALGSDDGIEGGYSASEGSLTEDSEGESGRLAERVSLIKKIKNEKNGELSEGGNHCESSQSDMER